MTQPNARVAVKPPQPDHKQQQNNHNNEQQGMEPMSAQVRQHYDKSMPHSKPATPDPFPPTVLRGLGLATVIGAIVGAAFGYLLANNILVIPGWELMYSGAPATIYTLWTFIGIAVGVATIGVAAIFMAPHESQDEHEPEHTAHMPATAKTGERERSVGAR